MVQHGEFSTVIDCIVYVSSVANAKKHSRKIACLESFAEGVKNSGSSVLVEWDYLYQPSRLALMLGWATTNTGGQNIALRKQIIQEQQRRGLHTMCIDASCWKYTDNQGTYLRYSLGGPFYDRAEYANHHSNDSQWQRIQRDLNVGLKPPVKNDGHILVCIQRDGGFAMKTLNPLDWAEEKIRQIRAFTNRPILVRPHPGESKTLDYSRFNLPGVSVADSTATTLLQSLSGAHSAVFFNSSASVAAVCEGIPVFVDDSSCVSWAVANKDISQIESPAEFDRTQWINDLAAAHWTDEDGRQGRIYQKFLPYINR
jgi:hypothetical protein